MLDIDVRKAKLRLKQALLDEARAEAEAIYDSQSATLSRKMAQLEYKEAIIEAYSDAALDDDGEVRIELEAEDDED